MHTFDEYSLKKEVLQAIQEIHFTTPTTIQHLVIPHALKNQNIIGKGKTGSGKTHAFLIPLANKIQKDKPILQSILLVPTRELALQLYQCCKIFFKNFPEVKISCLMGGQESQKDIEKLNVTPQILIGTPERIQHIVIDNGLLNLSTVSTLIIDEADMTLEMGFLNEVDCIASLIHPQAQIMVFSATIPVGIRPFLKKYLKNPILIEDDKSSDHENIEHILYPSKERNIYDILDLILQNINPYVCLIFANTKKEVENIYNELHLRNYDVEMIHGDLKSRERKKNIKRSLNGEFKYIIASDIASRGIDIPGVSHVISIGMPSIEHLDFYMHRAGRCGRNNLTGQCITIYQNKDKEAISKLSDQGITFVTKEIKNHEWKTLKNFDSRKKRMKKPGEMDVEIKKVIHQNRLKKVKPNYKKKIKLQIDQIKRKHKREFIKKEIKKRQIQKYKEGNQ